jgi:hypothetical protein
VTRRALSYTQRAVLLSVRAALRAGRVDLADQADGTTLATSTAPDGTVLLRATLRMPVRGVDTRTPGLPNVNPVPTPAAEPPAPVAVVRGAEAPEAPALQAPPRVEHHGVAVGDTITLDDEAFAVTVSDEFGWQGVTVETTPSGRPVADVQCLWHEVECVGERAWRTRPVLSYLKTPAQEREAAKPAKPKRAAKAPKARPARLTPEPEADALTRHGQRCVVAQLHEGGAWELVWCDEMPGQMTHDVAVSAVMEQAARARVYDRGGRCVRDSADKGEP